MGLYEAIAVAEVEVLGDLTGSYCTSVLSVGIFEENIKQGFLVL